MLVACGGAARNAPAPPETITVAAPPEALTVAAKLDPPQWLDASTDDAEATLAEPDDAGVRGPVRIGAVTVTGGRAPELVQRAILGSTGDMTRCHEAATAHGPRPSGAMRVRLMVAGSGQILSATHVGGTAPAPLVKCVLDAARRVKAFGMTVALTGFVWPAISSISSGVYPQSASGAYARAAPLMQRARSMNFGCLDHVGFRVSPARSASAHEYVST